MFRLSNLGDNLLNGTLTSSWSKTPIWNPYYRPFSHLIYHWQDLFGQSLKYFAIFEFWRQKIKIQIKRFFLKYLNFRAKKQNSNKTFKICFWNLIFWVQFSISFLEEDLIVRREHNSLMVLLFQDAKHPRCVGDLEVLLRSMSFTLFFSRQIMMIAFHPSRQLFHIRPVQLDQKQSQIWPLICLLKSIHLLYKSPVFVFQRSQHSVEKSLKKSETIAQKM